MIVGFGGGDAQTYNYEQFTFKYGAASASNAPMAKLRNKRLSQFGKGHASFAKVIK